MQSLRSRKPDMLRWVGHASAAVAVLVAALVVGSFERHQGQARSSACEQNRLKMASTQEHVEEYTASIFKLLRAISLNSDVKTMSSESEEYLSALFGDYYDEHELPEVYVIKRDFDGKNPPFMVFERGDAQHEVEELHSLEREAGEYQRQMEQIRRFAEQPSLKALLSPEVTLCVDEPGVILSVPIRLAGELVGIVAGMIPTERLSRELERSNYKNMVVLVNERGDFFGSVDLSEDTAKRFRHQLELRGVRAFFDRNDNPFHVGEYLSLWTPISMPGDQKWYMAFMYEEAAYLHASAVWGRATGWGIGGVVVLLGMFLNGLCRSLRRRLLLMRDLEVARNVAEDATRAKSDLLREVSQTNRMLGTEIAERKQAENKLRKLSVAVEQSPATVVITDTEGTIEYVNPRFTETTGYTAEEAVGRNPRILKSGDMSPAAYKEMWETVLAGQVWRGEFRNRRKSGELYWEAASIAPIRNNQGAITHVMGVKEDITDRKRAEEESRELETRYRDLFESANDVILLVDPEGDIVDINRRAQELTGFSRDELLRSNVFRDLIVPEDRAKIAQVVRRPLAGRSQVYEVRWRAKDGSVITLEGSSSPRWSPGGEFLTTRCILRDVTARKGAEEKLRQAKDAADAANNAKSEFLANMSHEIRTPMTAILGFSDILLDPSTNPTDSVNAAHTIRRNGEALLDIINDILDISKIEAGKLAIEQVDCPVVPHLADVEALMRVRADANGLAFEIECVGAVPETIRTDPTRLRQILVNLIGNAIKFTETGGVRVVVRLVLDEGTQPYMQFDVIDTGIGITEAQAERIFAPFTQADSSTTRHFGGTGLGLTISRRLAELLGGDITVCSRPGEGSLFRATVATGPLDGVKILDNPMERAGARLETRSDHPASDAQLHCRILVAEDGPDNQVFISHVLRKAGAEVTVVENGKLALEEALAARDRGEAFDVILMDMQMPVMDGYQATSLLRRRGYTGIIIALTAHAMQSHREKCIKAGCDGYASKPINRKTLISLIQERTAVTSSLVKECI